jgi:hypothetical protein
MLGRRRRSESEEWRLFMRETLLRYDRGIASMREENRLYFEELHAQSERESRRIDDLLAESRAQRQALLSILHRMNGNGGPAAAT